MRISDWSSDVCSSDLIQRARKLMKLSTWNVNSLSVRLPQLIDWLASNPVDALVLQETKLTDDKLPNAELQEANSEKRGVGKECVNTCRTRWSTYHQKTTEPVYDDNTNLK